ncbi:hypothetical protein D3C75_1241000 [compost metagenome]
MQYLLLQRGDGGHVLRMYMMPDTPLQRRERIVSEVISIQAVNPAQQQFDLNLLKLLLASRTCNLLFVSPFHSCHIISTPLIIAVVPD